MIGLHNTQTIENGKFDIMINNRGLFISALGGPMHAVDISPNHIEFKEIKEIDKRNYTISYTNDGILTQKHFTRQFTLLEF